MPAQQALPWEPELEEPQALELETLPEKKIQLPINIGSIGRKNLNKYLNKERDTTFGFKYNNKDGEYYLGNTRVDFKGDDWEVVNDIQELQVFGICWPQRESQCLV